MQIWDMFCKQSRNFFWMTLYFTMQYLHSPFCSGLATPITFLHLCIEFVPHSSRLADEVDHRGDGQWCGWFRGKIRPQEDQRIRCWTRQIFRSGASNWYYSVLFEEVRFFQAQPLSECTRNWSNSIKPALCHFAMWLHLIWMNMSVCWNITKYRSSN